jgi:hypothetical protein
MSLKFDIDIDFADRTAVLEKVKHHTPATIIRANELIKHNTGAYFTDVPTDPVKGICSLDHKDAEERGYFKLDLLNVNVYSQVESEEHLIDLMFTEPPWERLAEKEYCEQVIHIGNQYDLIKKMMPNTIPRMAMFLSVIRPAKRYLIGKTWKEIGEQVWEKPDEGYYFKKSHAVAYAHLVVVHMNLLNLLD